MAIAFRASGADVHTNATTIDVPWPANSVNDMAFLFLQTQGTSPTTPVGWTPLYNTPGSNNANLAVYYQQVTSVQSGSVSLTDSSPTHQAYIATFSGVDYTVAPTVAVYNKAKTTSWTTASVNWSGAYILVLWGSPNAFFWNTVPTASAGTATITDGSYSQYNDSSGTLCGSFEMDYGPFTAPTTATINASPSSSLAYASYAIVMAAAPPPPTASFTATPTSGYSPLTVNFTDTSTGTPTSWSWDFGDGSTSTAQNPSHTYSKGGTYSVTLTATNSGGSTASTQSSMVSVTQAPLSAVARRASAIGVVASSSSMNFTWPANQVGDFAILTVSADQAMNTPSGWTLLTSDSTNTSSRLYVYWQYISAVQSGTFSVGSSNIVNENGILATYSGASSAMPTVTTAHGSSTAPTSASTTFTTYAILAGAAPAGSTTFSAEAATTGTWIASEAGESNAQSAPDSLLADGPITANTTTTLTASLSTSNNWAVAAIAPALQGTPPTASFTATPTSGYSPLTVNFTDTSTGTPTSWSWDFGDGSTSTAQNPSHTYTKAGTYTVSLTASNAGGPSISTQTNLVTAYLPLPYTETWTGTDGIGWPGYWTGNITYGSSGSATIQSNQGQITTSSGVNNGYREILTAMPPIADTDLVVSFVYPSQVDGYIRFGINGDTTSASTTGWSWAATNGYYLQFASSTTATAANYQVVKELSDSQTTLINTTTTTITAGTSYTVRFQRHGTAIGFKIWTTGSAEPDVWTATATDTGTQPPAGKVILSIGSATTIASRTGSFDNLTVAPTPTGSPIAYVSSTIQSYYAGTTNPYALSLSAPSSITAGNTLVAIILDAPDSPYYVAVTPPSGWTLAGVNTGNSLCMWVYTKVATASEPASYSFNLQESSTNSLSGNGAILQYSGVSLSSPVNVIGFSETTTATASAPSVTTTVANTLLVHAFGSGANATYSTPTGETLRTSDVNTSDVGSLYIFDMAAAAAGATAVSSSTQGGGDTGYLTDTTTFALAPAPVLSSTPSASFTATPTSGTAPLTVNFTDTSTYSPTSWSWDFGDGTTSTAQNPSHTYSSAGTYTVALTATNAYGSNTDTQTGLITANSVPQLVQQNAGSSSSSTTLVISLPSVTAGDALVISTANWITGGGVAVSTVSDSAGGSWAQAATQTNPDGVQAQWYCGSHPGSASAVSVTITFASATTAVANLSDWSQSLTIGNTTTAVYPTTATKSITVTTTAGQLAVGFAAMTDNSIPTAVSPTTILTGATSQYAGGAGGYLLASGTTTTLTWTGNAVQSRLLAVAYSGAAAAGSPVASFTASPTSGTAPLAVTFTDTSTNSPTSWSWTFGDGATSTSQNPSHTYTTAGTYTVALTATNSSGSNTSTQSNLITVNAAPFSLPYTETWTGANGAAWPSYWAGNITYGSGGGASIQSDMGQITSGTGANYGYREVLTAMPNISDTSVVCDFVYPSQVDGYVRFGINADTTSSANVGWKWASQNGYFLQFATNSTASSATYQLVKQVADTQTTLVAVTTTTITAGVSYTVRFQRLGSVVSFKIWDASGSEPPAWTGTVTDSGTMPGAGIVILSVGSASTSADRSGSFDNLTVSVPGSPVASFTAAPTSGVAPLAVSFTDTSTNTPTSWSWDFGDGTTSTAQNPSHTYSSGGAYTVTLTATNSGGSDTATMTNLVGVIAPRASQIFQNWDGGTGAADGVTIAAANTNGPGNTPLATVTIGSSSTFTFSAAEAHSNALSAYFNQASNTAGVTYATINLTTTVGVRWVYRLYVYMTAFPSAAQWSFGNIYGGGTMVSGLYITTTGTIAYGAKAAFDSGVAMPLNQWVRVELGTTVGATTAQGYVDCAIFLTADSLTPSYASGQVNTSTVGTTAADTARLGGGSNVSGVRTWYLDDWAFDANLPSGYIGPSFPVTTGNIKTYDGSLFRPKPIRAWDGTGWIQKPLKHWDGTAWTETPY